MGPFRWLLIHDNRMLAERAFYCFVALLSCSRLFFRKCDQDQSDRKEEDQRQHAVFGVVEKVCTEGNDQRAEEVRKLAEQSHDAVGSITNHVEGIRQSVADASTSILKGSQSVETGLEKIRVARTEAENLGNIQKTSLQTAEDIFGSSQETKNSVNGVVEKSEHMTTLMEHSSEMVSDIRKRLDTQESLPQDMDRVFYQVSDVSGQLKEIVTSSKENEIA